MHWCVKLEKAVWEQVVWGQEGVNGNENTWVTNWIEHSKQRLGTEENGISEIQDELLKFCQNSEEKVYKGKNDERKDGFNLK